MKIQEITQNSEFQLRRRENKRKKLKRKLFWIKFVLIFILLTVTLVLVALSPLFNITKIEVQGVQYYQPDRIISATDIVIGDNGFRTIGSNIINIVSFRYGKAEKNILATCPYVKNVTVKFIVPGKVKIDIVERTPMAVVPYVGNDLLIDGDRYVVDTVSKEKDVNLPVIKGVKFESYKLGQVLNVDDADKLNNYFKLIQRIKYLEEDADMKIVDLIKSVDMSDSQKICLYIDSRIVVNFGDIESLKQQELNYKINFLKQLLTKEIRKEDKGFLDLTEENPRFIPDKTKLHSDEVG